MRHATRLAVAFIPLAVAACATASSRAGGPSSPPAYFWTDVPADASHTLLPTPSTVVVGGYDAAARPALTVNSGDDVNVGAVSTCAARLLQPGKDSGTIEPAYRGIMQAIRDSTLRRGPGGHILTGPIYVTGADSGDVLEVRIKSVDIDLPFAWATGTPRRATERWTSPRSRRRCAAACS